MSPVSATPSAAFVNGIFKIVVLDASPAVRGYLREAAATSKLVDAQREAEIFGMMNLLAVGVAHRHHGDFLRRAGDSLSWVIGNARWFEFRFVSAASPAHAIASVAFLVAYFKARPTLPAHLDH